VVKQPLAAVSLVTAPTKRSTRPRGGRPPYAGSVPRARPIAPPAPLLVAAALAALEGVLVLGYGVLEATHVHADRAAMGITSSAFFLILGAALVAAAWLVGHGRPGARSPIIVVQLMLVGLAWNFRGGSTTWVAVALATLAALVLAGLLHPASTAALTDHEGAGAR
jgi:hypothetical protein